MPVTADWDDSAHRIIHIQFENRWTWDEFHLVFQQYIKWLDEAEQTVDFIADFTHSRGIPSNALQQVKRLADLNHPKAGLTVYVGMNAMLQALGRVFIAIYPKSAEHYKFDFAKTIEEAHVKIAVRRAENK